MIKKLLNGKATTITNAAVIIGAASFASRLLGVLRDRILAGEFGAGNVLDAYFAAFRIPDIVFNLLVLGALSAGFIPLFTEYLEIHKKGEAWKLANNILNSLLFGLIFICAIGVIFAPQLMHLITPGFDREQLSVTVELTRIMFLSPLLLGLSSVFGGILQSFKRFFVYSLAPIVYNVGIIIGALVFVPYWGIHGLAYGVVLGALLHLLIQVPTTLKLGFRYNPLVNLRDKGMLRIGKIMVPRTLTLAIVQINLVVITIIASTLQEGSLTVFNFAQNLQIFPVGIFGISFAIAAFPTLCSFATKGSYKDFVNSFSTTVRQILFFIVPSMVLYFILRAQIIRIILGTGLFGWEDTILTMNALAMFTFSLFAQALIPLLIRAFYAFQDSVTPFIIGLIGVGVNIYFSIVLSSPFEFLGNGYDMGVVGLALAFTIANIVQMVTLWIVLRLRTKSLNEARILLSLLKISAAAVAMGVVVQFMKGGIEPYFGTDTFIGIFLQGTISALVGVAVFIVVGLALQLEEMHIFVKSIKKRLFKNKENYPKMGIDENIEV